MLAAKAYWHGESCAVSGRLTSTRPFANFWVLPHRGLRSAGHCCTSAQLISIPNGGFRQMPAQPNELDRFDTLLLKQYAELPAVVNIVHQDAH